MVVTKALEKGITPTTRKAKIVCTIGPASGSEAALRDLMRLGMDVARLNFSHGTHDEHARMIERLRKVADKEGRTVCILQDLQGPKIRTGRLKYRTPIAIKSGAKLTITPRDISGTAALLSTTFKTLAKEVEPGARILLSDGLIELRVTALKGNDVECEVVNGGLLGEHKGINLPGTVVSVPSLTEKDEKDLEFGLKHGVDIVAVSFIRTADDVRLVKRQVRVHNSDAWVIAKLEKPQAIDPANLEEILDVADGVMVARGDLGVEMPPEKVPIIQKHVIRRAADWRKPVITATQMLESMIENPRPTRAEASDVANAILDGSDAVMLSAETASGKYPREAVAMMARIIEAAEHDWPFSPPASAPETTGAAIARAAGEVGAAVGARALVAFTMTGETARRLARCRSPIPLLAFTTESATRSQLALTWGAETFLVPPVAHTDDMVRQVEVALREITRCQVGDLVVMVAGSPPGTP